MSHWKEYKLGEIAELRKEGFMPNSDLVFPYIGLEHIEPESLSLNGIGKSSDVTSQKFKFYPDDVLYGKLRPYFKKVYSPDFEGVCSTDIYVIKAKNGVNSKYLFYLLATDEFTQLANSGSTGTRMPRADWKHLSETLWNIPDYPTQTAIASILSSLDEKIELNNAINRNLEALAQALFKQWFVDFNFPVDEYGNFSPLSGEMSEGQRGYKDSGGEMVESELGMIPKGWRVGKLGEVTLKSNTGADAIQRAPIVDHDTGIRCVRVGDMSNNRNFDKWGFCKIKNDDFKRYKLDIDDIVVTRTASLGLNKIIRRDIKGVYNNGLIRLKIDKTICLPLYIYQDFQNENYKVYIERISGDSSTRPNMQINYLLDYKLIIPTILIQSQFVKQISTIYDSIDSLNEENIRLSSLRDTLLPKLISGELEVNEALTQTEKAV